MFTVVLEQLLTDTARFADILLPVTTFLEHTDLYRAYGHNYLQLARPALPAEGEAKSNVEIFRLLARRMGFTEACFEDSEDDMLRALLDTPSEFLRGITLERLEAERSLALECDRYAVRRGWVQNLFRQVRIRSRSAAIFGSGGIAVRRCSAAEKIPAGTDLREERRQHE